jgi:hypothetical protein
MPEGSCIANNCYIQARYGVCDVVLDVKTVVSGDINRRAI